MRVTERVEQRLGLDLVGRRPDQQAALAIGLAQYLAIAARITGRRTRIAFAAASERQRDGEKKQEVARGRHRVLSPVAGLNLVSPAFVPL